MEYILQKFAQNVGTIILQQPTTLSSTETNGSQNSIIFGAISQALIFRGPTQQGGFPMNTDSQPNNQSSFNKIRNNLV